MMNILHIYKDYHPVIGGIENTIRWLAEAQAEQGHTVEVLVAGLPHQPAREVKNGVTIRRLPRLATVASTPLTPSLPWAIRHYRPDVTHIHSPFPPGELFNALLGRSRATLITHYADITRQQTILKVYRPFLKRVLHQADLITAISPNYIDSSPFLRPHQAKCRVIPIGIDPTPYRTPVAADRLAALRTQFGGGPILLFVGRLRYYKGLPTLLHALPHIPSAQLVIVGIGPLEAELRQLTHELGLADRVHFAGEVSDADLPAYFQAADLFVLPSNSRAEAFGIVLLEAMAAGLPCLSTELGTGTSYVNQHGVTGFVVPPLDPPRMALAINILLANESLRQAFGQNARRRVETEFSRDLMVQRVMAVYRELVADS